MSARRTASPGTMRRALCAAVLCGLASGSCDSRGPTNPASPSPAGLVRVELAVPESIAPGESVQLTATAVRSDNTAENVSGLAQWRSSDRNILDVSSTGVARGLARGEAVVSVSYQQRSASAGALVLPAGTYRLRGTVMENGIALAGATVTVLEGEGAGLSAGTNGVGRYVLYGAGGRVRLQARSPGYVDQTTEFDLADHRTVDFELRLERPRTDLRGRYTLTIEPACSLPLLGGRRSYEATVSQEGSRLAVLLSGADFHVTSGHGRGFGGIIDGADRVTFTLTSAFHDFYGYYGGYHYDLVERISEARVLLISGAVTARPSSGGISGTLNGHFALAEGRVAPFTQIIERCHWTAHPFEMVRRER